MHLNGLLKLGCHIRQELLEQHMSFIKHVISTGKLTGNDWEHPKKTNLQRYHPKNLSAPFPGPPGTLPVNRTSTHSIPPLPRRLTLFPRPLNAFPLSTSDARRPFLLPIHKSKSCVFPRGTWVTEDSY